MNWFDEEIEETEDLINEDWETDPDLIEFDNFFYKKRRRQNKRNIGYILEKGFNLESEYNHEWIELKKKEIDELVKLRDWILSKFTIEDRSILFNFRNSSVFFQSKNRKKFGEIIAKYDRLEKGGINIHPKSISVLMYTLEGKFMKQFDSIAGASREIGGSHETIINLVCKRVYFQINRRIFRYASQQYIAGVDLPNEELVRKTRKKPVYEVKHSNKPIAVNQYDKDGNFIQSFINISAASKKLRIHSNSIRYCIRGKREFAGGFIFKKAEDCEEN
ncbi:MAG: NUMOD1 domain-containing DNA-binding protein [Chitinophagaceae bacterium]